MNLPHRVDLVRMRPVVDPRHGHEVPEPSGSGGPASLTGLPCRVDVASSEEDLADRTQTVERWDLILVLPTGEPAPEADDELILTDFGGARAKIDGEPSAVWDSRKLHHYELSAYRVKG